LASGKSEMGQNSFLKMRNGGGKVGFLRSMEGRALAVVPAIPEPASAKKE